VTIKNIVQRFGGQTALAKRIGINQSGVAYWVKTGNIPSKWHPMLIEIAQSSGISLDASELTFQDKSTAVPRVSSANLAMSQYSPAASLTPFMFYASNDGSVRVQVMLGDETVWASQKGMAEIFDIDVRTVSEHLQNIFKTNELEESTAIRKFRIVVDSGNDSNVNFYSLDAIISVGYRVNSFQATQFRRWATTVLKDYLIKGFVLDDERLKQGNQMFGKDYFDELLEKIREIRASERRFYQKITDLYAQCSIDYDPNSPVSQHFYAHVQDKLHFATHGHTSAELIAQRVDASKPNMGLTSWKNEAKGGKITKLDVTIGKNYLNKNEIEDLDRLVSMYLDWAENFARRQKPLTMGDWVKKLDGFLEFNAYDVLQTYGKVRRDMAERRAIGEYEKYRVVQDQNYKSDFDKVVEDIKVKKKLPKPQ
jgi:hypothetical protein